MKILHKRAVKTLHKRAVKRKMAKKTAKAPVSKKAHRRISAVRPEPEKPVVKAGFHKPGEKSKGQSALATAVAEDELEERRRLFAKARKGDKGAVAKIYELYGARIYTTAQVKEVKPARYSSPVLPLRRRAQRG